MLAKSLRDPGGICQVPTVVDPGLGGTVRGMFRAALSPRADKGRVAVRAGASICAPALLLAGCGGGGERQDENEPAGRYPVEVVEAKFPEKQKLAKRSRMEIRVKNVGKRVIPNVSVTVSDFDRQLKKAGEPDKNDPSVADPKRPVFVVNKSPLEFLRKPSKSQKSLVDREVDPPAGDDKKPAFVDTYSLGRLRPGRTAVFRWNITAVHPGPYRLRYVVAAGLHGRAKAVLAAGGAADGDFNGTIERKAPEASVDPDDGETVITEE